MATLSVLKFHTPTGADEALDLVKSLQKQQLITLQDAAIVTWPEGAKKPKTRQLINLAGMGAMNGAFWGMLFGLIFFVPLLGMAVGAAFGALGASMADVGIDDEFINKTKGKVTEGTSALFLLTSDATTDKVVDQMKKLDFEIVSTSLSQEEEDKLRAAFSEE
ncbi:MAG: DUF1269 domain-containing protein [Chloroflexota bacterium]|nr:MAG: DUF1269 domain-containing protein [Chloroflexota bacterium]